VKRVAIWGASGFAGAALANAAEARGWSVKRLGRAELPFEATGEQMSAALRGSNFAFHCAGSAAGDQQGYADAATRFALACDADGVHHMVYLSTVAVYGTHYAGHVAVDAPLLGHGPYAASRISAEHGIRAALSGGGCRWTVVRVPMLVGKGMPGTALARLAGFARYGVFPHPGPEEALLACLGVRRLAEILVRLADSAAGGAWQFADHYRWAELARRSGALHGRRVLRVRLPPLGGRLRVLSSTTRYEDQSARLAGNTTLPSTDLDLEVALKA
jgi:nucleoside-diphosphate-sugar epimerase